MRPFVAAAVVALAFTMTGCAPGLSSTGTPLTISQSERLAATRFRLFDAGNFVVRIVYLDASDVAHIDAELTVDPGKGRAWGMLRRGPEKLEVSEPVLVTSGAIAVLRAGVWGTSGLSPVAERALQAAFALGADRPENASLLRQSDAVFLGDAELRGERLEVYRVPSIQAGVTARTRLWLTPEGNLRRMDFGEHGNLEIELTGGPPLPQPAAAEEVWHELEG